jgi:hypothetical protein
MLAPAAAPEAKFDELFNSIQGGQYMVTLSDARKVIAAAEKKAAAIGQPMNIAVADGGKLATTSAWTGPDRKY